MYTDIDLYMTKGGDRMITAVLLLLLTGVLAFVCAAIVGWQIIAAVVAGIIVFRILRHYILKRD